MAGSATTVGEKVKAVFTYVAGQLVTP